MDMLVLFPLEFLANFPAGKPVLKVLKGKDVTGAKKGQDEGDVKAKLRLESAAALPAKAGRH